MTITNCDQTEGASQGINEWSVTNTFPTGKRDEGLEE